MTASSATPFQTPWIAPNIGFDFLTIGPRHHFSGYSDKCPWDENNRDILATESSFADKMPTANDALSLGIIPHGTRRFEIFDKTSAWCWQQGAMLQWLPPFNNNGRKVIYNQRVGNRFVSVIRDLETGAVRNAIRTLPLPIYAVSPRGDYALSLNFLRLNKQSPGYGYEGVKDHTQDDLCPAKDGVYYLDLQSGAWKLILSLQQAAALNPVPSMDGAMHHFNHLQINREGSRFAVIHRWRPTTDSANDSHEPSFSRLITLNPNGSEPYLLADYGFFSHYAWANENQIIARVETPEKGRHSYIFDDQVDDKTGRKQIIGAGILDGEGNMTFSPDRKWLLSDTYPDKNHFRTLFLWKWPHGPRFDIAKFYSPPALAGPLRCDLQPRWNRSGTKICLDSAHAGTRQMYVLDVRKIIET